MKEIIQNRRTIRKFSQEIIPQEWLETYVEIARLSPSGANLQPLRYAIIQSSEAVSAVFEQTKWAGYLNGTYTPGPDERPTAFIAVMNDTNVSSAMKEFDAGAAIMAINLAAEEDGIGCCIMASINKKEISSVLDLPDTLEIMYVIALGYKKEHPVFVDMEEEKLKYYIENGVLQVPKRKKNDILVKIL